MDERKRYDIDKMTDGLSPMPHCTTIGKMHGMPVLKSQAL